MDLALSTPLPRYQRVIIWFGRQSSGQTRGNGNIPHDEPKCSFGTARGLPGGAALRPFWQALRQVSFFVCNTKRTGSPAGLPSLSANWLSGRSLLLWPQDKRTGSPAIPLLLAPGYANWLSGGLLRVLNFKPKSLILGSGPNLSSGSLIFGSGSSILRPNPYF